MSQTISSPKKHLLHYLHNRTNASNVCENTNFKVTFLACSCLQQPQKCLVSMIIFSSQPSLRKDMFTTTINFSFSNEQLNLFKATFAFVCVRESVSVCESVSVWVCERERECVYVWVCLCANVSLLLFTDENPPPLTFRSWLAYLRKTK